MPNLQHPNSYINKSSFEEVTSAVTFYVKKRNSRNDYILCSVPTISKIGEIASTNKTVIPEVLNYVRYIAAIRALEYNCDFINKAIKASNADDIKTLTTLSFDYINGKRDCGIHFSSKSSLLSASYFYQSSLYTLKESKQIIQYFENLLLTDKLAKIIPDFEVKLDKVDKFKTHYIEEADKLINTISADKDIFKYFVDYISNVANVETKSEDSKLVK